MFMLLFFANFLFFIIIGMILPQFWGYFECRYASTQQTTPLISILNVGRYPSGTINGQRGCLLIDLFGGRSTRVEMIKVNGCFQPVVVDEKLKNANEKNQ
jgi:hypothetical protein